MNTLIFDKISKTSFKDYLADVNQKKRECIKDPTSLNTSQSMVDITNRYNNYKSTGFWDAQRKDAKLTIINLATALKKN